ncbi:rab-GTPase-TBC domain-containing protein [Parachaetomium inaequale]|uniref:Rab-GTPase-TBC domain-containing protein n=1 Tax=Parachaetomium inaequale TaxID=2588326 RepID=A0AAN6PD50_9PEZI|nr:rab-GTPase-TBC domain-containing protein [Parachaetomium inaequale]
MAPQRFASVRHRGRPAPAARLTPFRDDTSLVALRYEQTKQAEPPIPLPPPRNPRRLTRTASTLTSSTATTTTATSPITVSPPLPPPQEEHPLFRAQRPPRPSQAEAWKRDSGAPTSSSITLHEEDAEDPLHRKILDDIADTPSVYSNEDEEIAGPPRTTLLIKQAARPPPLTVSIPARPANPESTVGSPTAPSPTRRVSLTQKLSKSFGIGPDGSKRLRKKMLGADRAAAAPAAPPAADPVRGPPSTSPKSPSTPQQPTGPRPSSPSVSADREHPEAPFSSATRSDSRSFAPITTPIPDDSLWDDFGALSFSKRGSIMFGGKNNLFKSLMMAAPNAKAEHATASPTPATDHVDAGNADADETTTAAEKPAPPVPSIRVSSMDVERESQKVRREYERAGGIEDWADLDGAEVDRYGFISPKRPVSRAETAVPRSSPFSSRRRNVLTKRPSTSYSSSLPGGFIRPPSRKVSARSLNTYTSDLSTISRRSTRSSIRSATNRLPHNRDRRWMDEASEMLSLQAGLTGITDDEKMGKTLEAQKRKEAERSEKWRKMATAVKTSTTASKDTAQPQPDPQTHLQQPHGQGIAAAHHHHHDHHDNGPIAAETDDYLIAEFRRLQAVASPDDVQIDLDVPRTVNGHIMFRRRYRGGQRLLFRVLHAISLHFPGTGYVQGMASLAATLLCYFDEERAFVMLVRLWRYRGLERLYEPGFGGLMGALGELEGRWLMTGAGRDVAAKLQKDLCIDATAYGTRWYLTLFNLSIPFPAQLRVWDVFMLLGDCPPEPTTAAASPITTPSVTASPITTDVDAGTPTPGEETTAPPPPKGLDILHATSAALIHALRDVLLDSDFENAMKALTAWIPVRDEDLLMKVARAEWRRHQGRGRLWEWERSTKLREGGKGVEREKEKKEGGKEGKQGKEKGVDKNEVGEEGGKKDKKEKEKEKKEKGKGIGLGMGMTRLWERGSEKDKDKGKDKQKSGGEEKEKDKDKDKEKA